MTFEEIIERIEFSARYIEGKAGKTFLLGEFDVKALREAIAKLRDYQALQSSDTSARLAAIKDIPTERVIALAQAEAAGLVSISASAVEGANQNTEPNEPLTLEELREMDGQPVYVVDRVYPPYSGWWIIGWTEDCFVLAAAKRRGTQYIVQNYGTDWVAYRRPPKEV